VNRAKQQLINVRIGQADECGDPVFAPVGIHPRKKPLFGFAYLLL
jgi:hypothetical protein